MADVTEHGSTDVSAPFEPRLAWRGGGVAGLVATAAMGIGITLVELSTLRVVIAGLYGLEGSLVAGWLAHLAHGTVFGVLFAAVLADPGLHRVTEWRWKTTVAGVVYALVLAVVGAGIVMPIWLGAVGFTTPPSIPNVTVPLLVWHLLYGLVLGALFPSVADA